MTVPEVLPASKTPAFWPAQPDALADLDISPTLVQDLFVRTVREQGQSSLGSLRERLKLPHMVLEPVFRQLRQQAYLDVKGMQGNDYHFGLTAAGKALAAERASICAYAGPAPVSLVAYDRAVRVQAARVRVSRNSLRQALGDLVLPENLLDQLGPALISQKALFLYGPTGNGKTSLAERLLRVYEDAVLIPYALEMSGYVITLFDPVLHRPLAEQPDDLDARWVLCHRPSVAAGGELVSEMLELRSDASSGIYSAPLQMKANNGIFIIDDFGRQLMSPRDLLNRWIVPLDRRVDYLMLRYGVKFQIPFELMVVFSTNLEPSDLADEAFLRRIHNKIFVDAVDEKAFDQIFHRVVSRFNIPFESDSSEYLRKLCLREGRTELRACYPADICNILISIGKYEGRPPYMSKSELERASALYFAKG